MRLTQFTNDMFYKKLKPKQKKDVQGLTYFTMLSNMLLSMFDWKGLPDTLPQRFLELILITTGQVAVGQVKGDLVCAWSTLGGEIDPYGLGSEVVATTLNGEQFRGERNKEVAWGVNNDMQAPDTLIYWISQQMAEADTSANLNVLYSRLTQIPVVKDEKEKQAVLDLLKEMLDGKFGSIISHNVFNGELEEEKPYTIELTDSNKIDRIQYLSRYFDDLLKRFCNFYGQPLQTQNKSAQTQEDELHGMDSMSFIIPLQMLKCRKELCDNINKIFGTDISVDFSVSWKAEYISFISNDTDGDGVKDVDEITEDVTEDIEEVDTDTDKEKGVDE